MSIFASSYLNEFLTKWCQNVTFAEQLFLAVQNSTNISILFNNQS